jgi:PAS domain S-box-containing protein
MDTPPDGPDALRPDELQEVVALCDSDGIILTWNLAGREITGFAPEEVVGYHIDSVVTAESREVIDHLLSVERQGSVLPGLPVRLETTFGWEVPAEVTLVTRLLPGGRKGYLVIFRDTTLQVQLREHLDRLDLLYRGLVEGSPDVVYVLDDKGKLLFINDTVESLLGYRKKDLVGKELIDIVHPEDRPRAYWPLRERRRTDRATRNLRLRLLTQDGKSRRYDLGFVYVSLDSIGLGAGGPGARAEGEGGLGTQGVARDVTEIVLLQEFSRQAELILPVCSVCHRIRVSEGERAEWIPLADYLERKAGVLYSHTYCPDHLPPS